MAEVTNLPSLKEQIALVMLVRWQTFRNRMRGRSEKLQLAGTIAWSIPIASVVLIASPALGFASYFLVASGKWLDLSMLLWLIFLFWQFAPLLTVELNPGFDGRNLLRFPLRFSAFFLLSTAYGLADLYAAAGILWHAVIALGVCIARPDLTSWTILAFAISVLMNLLFNRLLFAWLERALAQRRLREIVAALMVLAFVGIQFGNIFLRRGTLPLIRTLQQNARVWSGLPPALPGMVLQHAAAGETGAALRTVALLAIYTFVFGGLFALRLRAQFTGEDLGESAAPVPQKIAVKSAPSPIPATQATREREAGLFSGIVDTAAAAIFVKELRYFYRNSMLLMNAFMPLVLIAFLSVSSSMPGRRGQGSFFARFGAEFAYPAAVAYILLLMTNFCPNSLAYEGRGIERLFLAPVKFRDVMLGKNLFHGALLALEALLALAVVAVLGHPPSPQVLLATWSGLLFAGLVHLGAGNWLSLQFPRRFEFGVRRQRPSGLTAVITLGVFFGEMAIIGVAGYICISVAGMWLLPAVYLALSAGAFVFYRFILEGTTRQAVQQRDALLEQLSR